MSKKSSDPGNPPWSRIVLEQFNEVRKALPELLRGKKPLGMGGWGIVGGDENTATKIVWAPGRRSRAEVLSVAEREIFLMQTFQGSPMEGVEMPKIVEPLRELNVDYYVATYTMTRVRGEDSKPLYNSQGNPMPADEIAEKAYNAGVLLAKFHKYAGRFDLPEAINHFGKQADTVMEVSYLSEEINQKLANANLFLKANMKSGAIHGDFHAENILWDGRTPCALLDFSFCGAVRNQYREFMKMPDEYVWDVVKGYEDTSGEVIKPVVIATRLAMWTEVANSLSHKSSDWERQAPEKIKTLLKDIEPYLDA